jgi:hypothetical protein
MQAQNVYGATMATTSGLLTATGAETVHDTTVTISYSIAGKAYSKAAITDGTTPTSDGNGDALPAISAGTGVSVVWALDASGSVTLFQGDAKSLDAAGNFEVAPPFPGVNMDNYCPFAYMIIKNAAGSADFTVGTSNWNATGATVSIQDVHQLPARPQTS